MLVRSARSTVVVVLLLMGTVTLVSVLLPRLIGWQTYVVTSGSMSPTFDAGAVVVSRPIAGEEVRIGDVVTFKEPSGLTTHRVIGMTSTSSAGVPTRTFTTKGDANEEADPALLSERNVVGKAEVKVPYLGYVVAFVKSQLGAGLLAVLVLFLLFSAEGRSLRPGRDDADTAIPESALVS